MSSNVLRLEIPRTERLMLAWQPALPVRGRIASVWWRTAVLLGATGALVEAALGEDQPTAWLLESLERPPGAGVWVWEGAPVERPGATSLDMTSGRWR